MDARTRRAGHKRFGSHSADPRTADVEASLPPVSVRNRSGPCGPLGTDWTGSTAHDVEAAVWGCGVDATEDPVAWIES